MVKNVTELKAAISNAKGGDVIILDAGEYGPLSLSKIAFASPVTLKGKAVFNNVVLSDIVNLNFDGVVFDGQTKDETTVSITNLKDVKISNCSFVGGFKANGFGVGKGLVAIGSNRIVVDKCAFSKFKVAAQFISIADCKFINSQVFDIAGDGVNVITSNGMLIEGCYFHDFWNEGDGHHPDMVQVWTVGSSPSTKNLTVRGCIFNQGKGDWTQTMLLRGAAGAHQKLENALVEDNLIFNSHKHGITIMESIGAIVRHNTLIECKTGKTYSLDPRIHVWINSVTPTVEGNVCAQIWLDGNIHLEKDNYVLFRNATAIRALFDDDLAPKTQLNAGSSLTLKSWGTPAPAPSPTPGTPKEEIQAMIDASLKAKLLELAELINKACQE